MRRNIKVVQINGFRGLFIAMFVISCLIAGFIAFPAFLAMMAWNYIAIKTGSFNSINYAGGALLWGIIAFSIFIFNKKKFIVSFNAQQELSDEEVKEVISKIKSKTLNNSILIPKDFQNDNNNIKKETIEEVKEIQTENSEN